VPWTPAVACTVAELTAAELTAAELTAAGERPVGAAAAWTEWTCRVRGPAVRACLVVTLGSEYRSGVVAASARKGPVSVGRGRSAELAATGDSAAGDSAAGDSAAGDRPAADRPAGAGAATSVAAGSRETRDSRAREPVSRFSTPPIRSIPAMIRSGKASASSRTGGVGLTEQPPDRGADRRRHRRRRTGAFPLCVRTHLSSANSPASGRWPDGGEPRARFAAAKPCLPLGTTPRSTPSQQGNGE